MRETIGAIFLGIAIVIIVFYLVIRPLVAIGDIPGEIRDLRESLLKEVWKLYREKLTDIIALEADNKRLKKELEERPIMHVTEQTMKPIPLVVENLVELDTPMELVKESMARKIAEGIEPYIMYEESIDTEFRGKRVRAYLYVMNK